MGIRHSGQGKSESRSWAGEKNLWSQGKSLGMKAATHCGN